MTKTLAQIDGDLAALRAKAEALSKEVARVRSEEASEALAAVQTLVQRYQFSESQIFGPLRISAALGRRGPIKRRAAAKVKFRDSDGNTWSGRGRKPRWFEDALARGLSTEDLRVS